jgi:hypothetical protein
VVIVYNNAVAAEFHSEYFAKLRGIHGAMMTMPQRRGLRTKRLNK